MFYLVAIVVSNLFGPGPNKNGISKNQRINIRINSRNNIDKMNRTQ